MPKRRPKFPGRINQLASKDVFSALLLAMRGKEFSPIESMLNLYYQTLERFRQIISGKKTIAHELFVNQEDWAKSEEHKYQHYIYQSLKDGQVALSELFITAVTNRDYGAILEIGHAVEFLKSFKESGDPVRTELLLMKRILDERNETMSIRDVAKNIMWPDMNPADGFAALRRLCKELKFPLAPSRQKTKK
jgi:hypothetical protein